MSFRWFSILTIILVILFFVILTHLIVEKCNKYWSNETEVVEIQEAEEQHSFFDFYTVVNYIIVISLLLFIRFSLQYVSLRTKLLLKDSKHILVCMIIIPNFYFKNPLLRHYVWKKIMKTSTVQPENNQFELQPISEVPSPGVPEVPWHPQILADQLTMYNYL